MVSCVTNSTLLMPSAKLPKTQIHMSPGEGRREGRGCVFQVLLKVFLTKKYAIPRCSGQIQYGSNTLCTWDHNYIISG